MIYLVSSQRNERHMTKKITSVTVATKKKVVREEKKDVNKDERLLLLYKKFLLWHSQPLHFSRIVPHAGTHTSKIRMYQLKGGIH